MTTSKIVCARSMQVQNACLEATIVLGPVLIPVGGDRHHAGRPALDLLLNPADRAATEMHPSRKQARTLQPVDMGEAVTDLVGQLTTTDDPHGTGASPNEASRDVW